MLKIEFTVNYTTEFGIAVSKRKCNKGLDEEETFRNAWNSIPKRMCNTWFSMEFPFGEVSRHHLTETNYNFWNSVDFT